MYPEHIAIIILLFLTVCAFGKAIVVARKQSIRAMAVHGYATLGLVFVGLIALTALELSIK